MSTDCPSAVIQSLPNEMIEETATDGGQCVTIVTDAINCSSQVLGERTEATDDTGICAFLYIVKKDLYIAYSIQLLETLCVQWYNEDG